MRDHVDTSRAVSGGTAADPDAPTAPAAAPGPGASLDRMLALWRTVARCEPASADGDASATLVPAAAPAHDAQLDDEAASTQRWFAPPRTGR
jgi:hypothetical protein